MQEWSETRVKGQGKERRVTTRGEVRDVFSGKVRSDWEIIRLGYGDEMESGKGQNGERHD